MVIDPGKYKTNIQLLISPDDNENLIKTLHQLQSAMELAKNEIYSMLVQDKLLGFFKSMGRYGDLLLDLEVGISGAVLLA